MSRIYIVVSLLFFFQNLLAQEPDTVLVLDSTSLEVRIVADGLDIPWDMVWGPDNRIWFTERNGNVKRLDLETGQVDSIYHIEDAYAGPENSGLHSMSLHPNFPLPAYVYFQYTYGTYSSKITRFTYDPNANTLTNQVDLISFIQANTSHNGSRMQWGNDTTLFVCLGEAYTYLDFPQDVYDLPGKVLRMREDGSVPDDNPIEGSLAWSWGHRNPQGLVIASNGKMYSSEHGPATDDELNIIEKGRNYGWPYVQGYCDEGVSPLPPVMETDFCTDSNVMEPILAWTPTQAPCGLDYYDHPAIPEWKNALLLCFLKEQQLKFLKLNVDGDEVLAEVDFLKHTYGRLRDVLVAPDGRVFICTSNQEWGLQSVYGLDKIIEIKNPSYHSDTAGLENLTETNVVLYPNPSTSDVFVKLPAVYENAQLQMVDALGNVVRSQSKFTEFSGYLIERGSLVSGVYHLRITTNRGVVSKKVVFN